MVLLRTRRVLVISVFACVFLAGCASSYKTIPFESLDYTGAQTTEGLQISYRYDAQPGYYGEKARKKGFDVVAVRVTNTTDTPITLSRESLRLQASGVPVSPVRPDIVADNTRQPVWSYLLWNLANVTITDEDGFVAFLPIGLAISIFNIAQSSSANGKAERTYVGENLMGQTVTPGGTVDGLLFLSSTNFAPLTFEYVGRTDVASPAEATAN